jgi:transcriptional regulator with XRE-family HTH domain
MHQINLADNIIRLRREKKITQEQLADFIGVTKAAVSKWENHQSMPDLLLLPQLAVFFNVTVDELIGFDPQLSKEQIQRIYQELATEFASGAFDDTFEHCKESIHRYYSCFPFLTQISLLLLNHLALATDAAKQQEVLKTITDVCEHIITNCASVVICNDATTIKVMAELQQGKAADVIETLEAIMDPRRISNQNEMILIQAYQLSGNGGKARSFTQITMYLHILGLIGNSMQYLALNSDNFTACEETIRRCKLLIETYSVDKLHPGIIAQFHNQVAIIFMQHEKKREALEELLLYAKTVEYLLSGKSMNLHGDSYFDSLDEWLTEMDLGSAPLRNTKIIRESFLQGLEHPLFSSLKDSAEFRQIRRRIEKE